MEQNNFDLNDEKDRKKLEDKINEAPKTSSLHINRVPKKTEERFKEIAHESFAGDYGWLLHWLLNREEIRRDVKDDIETLRDRMESLETVVAEQLEADENTDGKETETLN